LLPVAVAVALITVALAVPVVFLINQHVHYPQLVIQSL
jgi:hypothetical protein